MANNTDIVKEIEEAVSEMTSALAGAEVRHSSIAYLGIPTTEKIQTTLQRARDALRWIPCEERLPEEKGDYFVSICFPFPGMGEPFTKPAYYMNGKWYERDPMRYNTWLIEHVAAWQPKPAPYDRRRRGGEEAASPAETEMVKIPCLCCGKVWEFAADSNQARGIFNVFCPDDDCEDNYAGVL